MAAQIEITLTGLEPIQRYWVTAVKVGASLPGAAWLLYPLEGPALLTIDGFGAELQVGEYYNLWSCEGTAVTPNPATALFGATARAVIEETAPQPGRGGVGGVFLPAFPPVDEGDWEWLLSPDGSEPDPASPYWSGDRSGIEVDAAGQPLVSGHQYEVFFRRAGSDYYEGSAPFTHQASPFEDVFGEDDLDSVAGRGSKTTRKITVGSLKLQAPGGQSIEFTDDNGNVVYTLFQTPGQPLVWYHNASGSYSMFDQNGWLVSGKVETAGNLITRRNGQGGLYLFKADGVTARGSVGFVDEGDDMRVQNERSGRGAHLKGNGTFLSDGPIARQELPSSPNPDYIMGGINQDGLKVDIQLDLDRLATLLAPRVKELIGNMPTPVEIDQLPPWLTMFGFSTAGNTERQAHVKTVVSDLRMSVEHLGAATQPQGGSGAESWAARIGLQFTDQYPISPYSHRRPLNSRAGAVGLLGNTTYRFRFWRDSDPYTIYRVDYTIPATDTNGVVTVVGGPTSTNRKPVLITPILAQSAYEGQTYRLKVDTAFMDPDGETLTLGAQRLVNGSPAALPSYMSFNPLTQELEVLAGNMPAVGTTLTIRLTATDPVGNTEYTDLIWQVFSSGTPRVLEAWYNLSDTALLVKLGPATTAAEYRLNGIQWIAMPTAQGTYAAQGFHRVSLGTGLKVGDLVQVRAFDNPGDIISFTVVAAAGPRQMYPVTNDPVLAPEVQPSEGYPYDMVKVTLVPAGSEGYKPKVQTINPPPPGCVRIYAVDTASPNAGQQLTQAQFEDRLLYREVDYILYAWDCVEFPMRSFNRSPQNPGYIQGYAEFAVDTGNEPVSPVSLVKVALRKNNGSSYSVWAEVTGTMRPEFNKMTGGGFVSMMTKAEAAAIGVNLPGSYTHYYDPSSWSFDTTQTFKLRLNGVEYTISWQDPGVAFGTVTIVYPAQP